MLETIGSVMREVAHLSELTGLSAGALIGLVALAYFWPPARLLAIQVAVVVVAAYGSGLYCYHLAASDVRAQWAAADAVAAADAKTRDAAIAQKLVADNPAPTSAQQQEADTDEAKILGALSGATGGTCQLGADALRLRK